MTVLSKGKVKRGEVWEVDFTPQAHAAEPSKRGRPALIIQTNLLNGVGHSTTVVIPTTTDVDRNAHPLRVFIGKLQKPGEQPQDSDLMIDQIRAIANDRFMGDGPLTVLSTNHMKLVDGALKVIVGQ